MPPVSDPELARRVGKYDILTRLSLGGMAEIFLAVVTGPGGFRKFVVLKQILPELREDAEFVRMLLDEARITAALSHSNIAQVFDLGHDAEDLYVVMEFIAGRDLSTIMNAAALRATQVPIGFGCRVVRDVCIGLHYAHGFIDAGGAPLPIVHRDLSGRNVMVTYAGNTKIVDFGIAKAKGLLERTQDGAIKGSLAYMSPEQVLGESLDGRSDLFSAGILFHELLTGSRLFRVSGNDRATVERVLGGEVPPPHERSPRVSRALSDVALRALQRDRDARFATGKDMARAIEEAAGDAMFDDDKVAAFMEHLFAERIEQTRRLLAFSVKGTDASDLARAASALGKQPAAIPISRSEDPTQIREPSSTPSVSLSPASGPAVSWRTPPRPESRPPTAAPIVLAVDDSNVGRKLAELHLTRAGFEVVTCASGVDALAVLAEIRPGIIMLDVMMPGMDGFELCKRIRETHDGLIPIVFVSAACSLAERERGLEVGGDDFVRKPYEPAELVARMRAHLARVAALRP